MTTEFNLIQQYFQSRPQAHREDVVLGIGDDCALLSPPAHQHLAMSTDTLVEGVHYYPDADPRAIGHKALAVSLSDLAAMGATPAWAMLSLTLDQIREDWIKAFCEGFFALLDQYSMTLVGGNMSRGPSSITTQVTGFLPEGKGIRRSAAQPGDHIYVTGPLGDAALALAGLEGEIDIRPLSKLAAAREKRPAAVEFGKRSIAAEQMLALRAALDYPAPRIQIGLNLRDIAHAAIDISDGLLADLGHILEQSGVGATLDVEHIPLSRTARQLDLTFEQVVRYALTGGDDYELCFTAPPEKSAQCEIYTCIGMIEAVSGLRLLHKGQLFRIDERKGFEHF